MRHKLLTNLFVICFLNIITFTTIKAQSSCPVFVPKAATFVSANKAATVGNMSYVLDGEGTTGLPSNGQGNVVYWLQSVNPVTFYFDMKASSTISRVKFYQPWGFDEGAKNVTVRLYNGATLLGTEAIVLPSLYPAGYIAVLSKTYTNVTKIQMVIVDDYNISGATPKRTSLREVVFGDTTCDDIDGDGTANYLDLDNDNDGIKDIDENCSGFLAQNTSGVWKGKTASNLTATLTGATAQTAIYHAFSDEQIKYYVNQNGGDPRYYKAGTASFTYTFSTPVPANEIAFFVDDVDPSNGSTNASVNFKINGGDPNGNFVIANYSTNTATYLNYNPITGIMSTSSNLDDQRLIIKGVGDILVSSITITNSGIASADGVAYALLANHPCDTDGDGIVNIYDLDSDGDGCVDAIEGAGSFTSSQLTTASSTLSSQSPNENFGIAVDANGIPTTVGTTGQGIGESQDHTKNDCLDSDGDGYPNWQDLDDDNDGILDTSECGATDKISNGTFPTSGGNTNTLAGWVIGGTYPASGAWASPTGRINLNSNGLEFRRDFSSITTISQNLTGVMPSATIGINNLYWVKTQTNNATIPFILDISYGGIVYATIDSTYGDSPIITAKNGASVNMNSLPAITANPTTSAGIASTKSNLSITLPYNVANSGALLFTFTAGTNVNDVRDLGMQSVTLFSCKDTDGDTIPDFLDLDSDNDGCPDAIEGGASFTYSNLFDSTMPGGNIGATSGTYNQPVSQNLGNTVGNTATTMGVPTIAGEGQLAGTSQLAGIQDALCCIAPVQPTLSIVTQPTCSISTGSFTITNYNAAYTYAFTPSTGVVNTAGTVTAPSGNYTVTATLGSCSSLPSNLVVINSANCDVVCNEIVDDFNITQSITPINTSVANDYSVVTGVGILGGERDVALINKTGTLPHNFDIEFGYGYIDYAQGSGQKSTLVLQWDGIDNDASTLNPIGLGGISFNNVKSLDFHLFKDLTNTGLPITVELYTNAGNASSLTKIFNTGDNFDVSFKFSEFTTLLGSGVDLNNIGAVVLKIDPSLASGSGLDLQLNNFNFGCSVVSFCYKPAQTTGTTLDTNHGITALGRAGKDNSNWPMIRKGAWTALEAKTKGFVVNRLTDAQIIAIPESELVEGMMLYNTTQNCLQINIDGTATGWKCINTQTCPD